MRELAPLAGAALNKMESSWGGSSSGGGEIADLASKALNNLGGSSNFGAVSSSTSDDIPSLAKKALANLDAHKNDPEMQSLAKKALASLGGSFVQRGRFDVAP